jgi:hypothetical protein
MASGLERRCSLSSDWQALGRLLTICHALSVDCALRVRGLLSRRAGPGFQVCAQKGSQGSGDVRIAESVSTTSCQPGVAFQPSIADFADAVPLLFTPHADPISRRLMLSHCSHLQPTLLESLHSELLHSLTRTQHVHVGPTRDAWAVAIPAHAYNLPAAPAHNLLPLQPVPTPCLPFQPHAGADAARDGGRVQPVCAGRQQRGRQDARRGRAARAGVPGAVYCGTAQFGAVCGAPPFGVMLVFVSVLVFVLQS